jgi:Rieske Fe-S protein
VNLAAFREHVPCKRLPRLEERVAKDCRSAFPAPNRRDVLVAVAGLAAGPLLMPGCERPPAFDGPVTAVPGEFDQPGEPPLRVPLDSLAPGARVQVTWGRVSVELRRTGADVRARALVCPHQGCKVVWHEDRRHYNCVCHLGRFDEHGTPIEGVPASPLPTVPLAVSSTSVYVGARPGG